MTDDLPDKRISNGSIWISFGDDQLAASHHPAAANELYCSIGGIVDTSLFWIVP
jgi:hypothetical protein